MISQGQLFLDLDAWFPKDWLGVQGEIVKEHIDNLFNVASRKVHTIQDSSFVDVGKIHHKPMQTVSEISKTWIFLADQKGRLREK